MVSRQITYLFVGVLGKDKTLINFTNQQACQDLSNKVASFSPEQDSPSSLNGQLAPNKKHVSVSKYCHIMILYLSLKAWNSAGHYLPHWTLGR